MLGLCPRPHWGRCPQTPAKGNDSLWKPLQGTLCVPEGKIKKGCLLLEFMAADINILFGGYYPAKKIFVKTHASVLYCILYK